VTFRSRSDSSPPTGRRDRVPQTLGRALALSLCALLLAGCAERVETIPARGAVADFQVETTVDSPIARYYLERQLSERPAEPELEQQVESASVRIADGVPGHQELASKSQDFSTDLATLFLIDTLAEVPENSRLQAVFEEHLERVRGMAGEGITALRACTDALDLPVVWFVPGWFYETYPGTGARFDQQRALLERLGVEHRLVPLIENGTIETNAAILAEELRTLDAARDEVMLVSASKGGPEVSHAIGHLLAPEETRPVQAWINVGGMLRGTVLADWGTTWPISWLTPLYFAFVERRDPGDSVPSMTTERAEERLALETIPDHVMIINFLGVPLSGHITEPAEFGYNRMRPGGPNDGLTYILDKLAHGGRAIVQIGLDHYYRDPELDLKTVALALTVSTGMGRELPAECRLEIAAVEPSAS
jgi:hypothetical protein